MASRSPAEIGAQAPARSAARARIGRMALEATTVPEVLQRAAIEGRLSVDEWPDRPLVITAVEAVTGELARFDRDSGVPLVDAAAATSTAGSARSPTPIWPRG